MVNWINSWKSGNKKNKYSITIRLGKLMVFELKYCPCNKESCNKVRFILLNMGLEVN